MKKRLLTLCCASFGLIQAQNITYTELGRYTDGREGASEIAAYDSTTAKLFVTNAVSDSIDIVDISNPASPALVGGVDITLYGGGVNSVLNLNNGYIAAAIEANTKQDTGFVVFFDANGTFVKSLKVGALPDMITLTYDGKKILVANEGEPSDDYLNDPKGSISIIDISGGVSNLTQAMVTNLFFDNAPANIPGSIKKSGVSYAQDLEPEYIAVNATSTMAAVACQESNVMIFVDLTTNTISSYKGLGFKDHSVTGNGFDASNRDDAINIQTWDVKGIYQPDAISAYSVGGKDYYISANEGDGRDYAGYSSEARIKDLTLDATVFPNAAELQNDTMLGRLKTFTIDVIGDIDNDGDVDELYSYGARSFSIWDDAGNLVWDSGDDFEQYIQANHPDFFNCSDGLASEKDDRSDDKGPEPEAVVVGAIDGRIYAFIGLERQGGVMVYNITDPTNPVFENFIHSYQGDGTMTDVAPEGLIFVPKHQSHLNKNLLIVSNEFSGTVVMYQIDDLLSSVNSIDNNENNIRVYPNPASSMLNVSIESFDHTTVNYTLVNTLGVKVKTGTIKNANETINIADLSNGYYQLLIENNDAYVVKKVVVSK